jgi:hypothetical protein
LSPDSETGTKLLQTRRALAMLLAVMFAQHRPQT